MLSVRSAKGILALFAGALVSSAAADARADRRYPIRIESKPPGATIYFDVGDDARSETTPVDLRLAPGTYTIIFELDGYEDKVMDVTVARRRRQKSVVAELRRLNPAYVEVNPAAELEGSPVRIDGDERGKAPGKFEVSPGAHLVEVVDGDKAALSKWVDVEGGQTLTVGDGPPSSATQDPFDDTETPANIKKKEDKQSSGGEVKAGAKSGAAKGALFLVGAGLELGGRRFRFQGARRLNDMQKSLRPYDAFGLPLFRLLAEVYPLGQSGNPTLSGLGITGSYARAAPFQSTADEAIDPVDTSFSDFEIGALYHYYVRPSLYVGGRLTYAGREFAFDDGDNDPQSGIDSEVPSVDYRSFRFGAEAGGRSGRYTFFGGLSAGRVSQIGALADRFAGTNISAYGGRAGASAEIIPSIELQLIATYSLYMLSFRVPDPMTATYVADGGTDQFFGVMFSGLYVY